MKEDKKWFVIYTKPKFERRTADVLEKKQIPVYLPEYNTLQYFYGKKKMVKTPLLPSLLFVFLSEIQRDEITTIYGVAGVLYRLQKPATIKSKEIMAMQHFLAKHNDVTVEKVPLDNYAEFQTIQHNSTSDLYMDVPYEKQKLFLPSLGYSLIAKTVQLFDTNVA